MSRDPALPGRVLSPQRGHHVAVAAATALTPGARQGGEGVRLAPSARGREGLARASGLFSFSLFPFFL